MKAGKAAGTLEVSVEMIVVSGEIGIDVMVELCLRVLDGRGMPDEWEVTRGVLNKEKKLYMCFVDLEKAFDMVPRRVLEWAMRKRGIPEAMVRAVMSLYEDAKTRVRVVLGL
ncbi:PREDICTED: uncharacterized protein LOC107354527 [Acropora digitifera]|uniref:uncharacterized protein LOC107354527 n=1 Tax=Acropora digitifera TaxID=70779 RepID=UPI00077B230B|nr:PREDICTED: uncharacterized protein LOC107354527 [Acropora digitifera]